MRERLLEKLMLSGVTVVDPASTFVDAGVRVGMDTVIEPFARILGATVIGERCTVGACSILEDANLGDGVHVHPFTSVNGSHIANDVQVGPYARVRMGARIAARARVGNFVELKKADVGKGAKVNHLSYVGDAEVGEAANIGAGTITCNYDGFGKYKTVIGAGAFIGSNTALVAPVTVGDGAIVGAGSVITRDVEPESLAVERSEQKGISGWARRFRERMTRKAAE